MKYREKSRNKIYKSRNVIYNFEMGLCFAAGETAAAAIFILSYITGTEIYRTHIYEIQAE